MKFDEIIKQINPSVLKTADGMANLTKIFGQESISGFVEVIRNGADNLKNFQNELKNVDGEGQKMAAEKLNNLAGQFKDA